MLFLMENGAKLRSSLSAKLLRGAVKLLNKREFRIAILLVALCLLSVTKLTEECSSETNHQGIEVKVPAEQNKKEGSMVTVSSLLYFMTNYNFDAVAYGEGKLFVYRTNPEYFNLDVVYKEEFADGSLTRRAIGMLEDLLAVENSRDFFLKNTM